MTRLMSYLGMDVAAMTVNDWFGTILSVMIFAGFAYVYFMVLRSGNREKFESKRSMVLEDENPIEMGGRR